MTHPAIQTASVSERLPPDRAVAREHAIRDNQL